MSKGGGSLSQPMQANTGPRKPRILVAACGCVAAINFWNLCSGFSVWADVKAVVTKSALHFINQSTNPFPKNVTVYTDDHEWCSWSRIGDSVLHIELCRWADIMLIAPLSAHTLGKIAGGLCDNLLTSIVRAWEYNRKPIFVAPSMSPYMWGSAITEKNMVTIDDFGVNLIPPVAGRVGNVEYGCGEMAQVPVILSAIRVFIERQRARSSSNTSTKHI